MSLETNCIVIEDISGCRTRKLVFYFPCSERMSCNLCLKCVLSAPQSALVQKTPCNIRITPFCSHLGAVIPLHGHYHFLS